MFHEVFIRSKSNKNLNQHLCRETKKIKNCQDLESVGQHPLSISVISFSVHDILSSTWHLVIQGGKKRIKPCETIHLLMSCKRWSASPKFRCTGLIQHLQPICELHGADVRLPPYLVPTWIRFTCNAHN